MMAEYFIYSLKVAALMAVFYLFWRLLLERETLHRLNRIVLLLTAVGSFVLPLCVVTLHRVEVVPAEGGAGVATAGLWTAGEVAEPTLWERWSGVGGALLLVVTASMILHLIYNIWLLHRFIGRCELHERDGGVRIAVSEEPIAPSSWMHTIMLSRTDYAGLSPAVLAHERSHIRQRHSWDVLLLEIVVALQWFNPVVWMIRQDLRTVHEYEADAAVISDGIDTRAYFNMLIQKATGRGAYSMANGISNSTLKKRIKRMLKKKSNRWRGAKALYVVPVVAVSLAATAKTIVDYRQMPEETRNTVKEMNVVKESDENLMATYGEKDKNEDVLVTTKKVNEDGTPAKDTVVAHGPELMGTTVTAYRASGSTPPQSVMVKVNDDDNPVYDVCEELPEFPGGMSELMSFLSHFVKYPQEAHAKGIHGLVLVSYVVEKDGTISGAHVVQSVDPLLDNEALRVVSLMPKWKPGRQGGKPVRVKLTIPITFKLQ